MKKLTLVLALLVSFGLVGAFAQTIAPVVDFSADAEAVFGIDLNDDLSTGFTNSASAELKITWIDEETWENEGDGVYGWIQIEDIDFSLTAEDEGGSDQATASIGDITARIYFSPAYVEIYSNPGFGFNKATAVRVDDTDDADPVDTLGSDDLRASDGGITIGVEGIADMIDVAFKIGSAVTYAKDYNGVDGDLDASGANTDNLYVFGIDVSVAPMDMLSVDLGVVFSNDDATIYTFGAYVKPVISLDVMSGLEIALPVDLAGVRDDLVPANASADAIRWEFAPEMTLNLNEAGSNVMFKAFLAGNTDPINDGNMFMDLKFGFEEVAAGFVPGLASHLYFYLFDVLDTTDSSSDMGYGLNFGLSYDIDGIKPFVNAKYYVAPEDMGADDAMYSVVNEDGIGSEFLAFDAGVSISGLIDNTVFEIKYASKNLTNSDDALSGEIDKGRITFKAKVSY